MRAEPLDHRESGSPSVVADRIRVTFSPRPENVALARVLVGTMARRHGLPQDAVEDVRLLVSEACTNAVRAHVRNHDARPVSVTCMVDGEVLIEVSDTGGGFGSDIPDDVPFPKIGAVGADMDVSGYGIPLMQRIADRAVFATEPDGGTVVRLAVKVPARS